MSNPSPRDAALRKVLSAARSIITYQIGLPVGAQRLQRALTWLRPYESVDAAPVDEFLHEVRELPLGSERLYSSREALKRSDVPLEAACRKFRDPIFDVCFAILDRFPDSATDPTAKPHEESAGAGRDDRDA